MCFLTPDNFRRGSVWGRQPSPHGPYSDRIGSVSVRIGFCWIPKFPIWICLKNVRPARTPSSPTLAPTTDKSVCKASGWQKSNKKEQICDVAIKGFACGGKCSRDPIFASIKYFGVAKKRNDLLRGCPKKKRIASWRKIVSRNIIFPNIKYFGVAKKNRIGSIDGRYKIHWIAIGSV